MAAQVINKHLQQHIGKTGLSTKYEKEQESLPRQRSSNSKRSPVYVHQFSNINTKNSGFSPEVSFTSRNELHQNLYNHEMDSSSERYVTKLKSKSQTPTVKTRSGDLPHSRDQSHKKNFDKPTHAKSDPMQFLKPASTKPTKHKFKHNVLSNKDEIHRLEESYWAKWKPSNKPRIDKPLQPTPPSSSNKSKRIENNSFEKKKAHIRVIPTNKTKERGDSNETGDAAPKRSIPRDLHSSREKKEEKSESAANKNPFSTESCEDNQGTLPLILSKEGVEKGQTSLRKTESKHSSHSADCEDVKTLKHTDSLILTSKKQNQEKERYQQPKCIKLFKNTSTIASKSYVTGGTYPLKSCLKKEKSQVKGNIRLGRPGSPLIVQSCTSSRTSKKRNK